MGAAVALRDGVGEAEHGLVVAVVPPQRAFDRDAVALGLDHDRGGNERRLVAVEILDEGLDAALVAQLLALLDRVAHVGQHDPHARIEEGELAQPVLQRRVVELDHGEGARARQEGHLGAALGLPGLFLTGPTTASGASASPSRNSMKCSLPSRQIVSLSQVESALTTETPTPCRPPETL